MDYSKARWQWSLSVVVFHGPGFGHAIKTIEQTKGRDPWHNHVGDWNGLGVPAQVLDLTSARVNSILIDHMTNRYGIQGELPIKWAGEPDPF